MPSTTVLLAENNTQTLSNQLQQLKEKGYELIAATGRDGAEMVLNKIPIDVAVFDIHLEDDTDPKDFTGLELARNAAPEIAKFIFSDLKNYDDARRALNWPSKRNPDTVKFISKSNGGVNTLVKALEDWVPAQSTKPATKARRLRPMLALVSLLLTLLVGTAAVVFSESRLLFVTVALAIFSALLMSRPVK
jgi:CheY-like chemotaxis protein